MVLLLFDQIYYLLLNFQIIWAEIVFFIECPPNGSGVK